MHGGTITLKRYSPINIRSAAFLLVAALPFVPLRLSAQANESSFTEYLRHNARPLAVTDGKMTGPGAVWLQAEAMSAQFVFLGEEHGLADMELVTSAQWRDLVPLGFRHVAIEEGPWSASLLDRYVRNGDAQALAAYRSAVVPGLPPASDEHMAMVEALRQAKPSQRAAVVWGADQERRAVPLLSRLVALAPTSAARTAAQAALAEAQQREAAGRYFLGGYADQIGALWRAFSGR